MGVEGGEGGGQQLLSSVLTDEARVSQVHTRCKHKQGGTKLTGCTTALQTAITDRDVNRAIGVKQRWKAHKIASRSGRNMHRHTTDRPRQGATTKYLRLLRGV
jgi:hypothetical protein